MNTLAPRHNIISIGELWQFFNRSANLFCICGPDGFLKQVNPFMTELLGFDEQEWLSQPYLNFVHPENRVDSLAHSDRVRHGGDAVQFRNRLRNAGGGYRHIAWSATYIPQEDNVYLIGHDHSKMHEVEQKLAAERQDRHKMVLEASLLGQEHERAQIGKELHDNINQLLATSVIYQRLALSGDADTADMIGKSAEMIQKAIDEIRSLTRSLAGPNLAEIGLRDSLAELTITTRQITKMMVRFDCDEAIDRLPDKLKITLYRLVQEQFSNILRHAEASQIHLEIKRARGRVVMSLADDGRGFDPSAKRRGIGLNNMLSRVEIYNGSMSIDSAPGRGCRITFEIPDSV